MRFLYWKKSQTRNKYVLAVFFISKLIGIFPYDLKDNRFTYSILFCIVSFISFVCLLGGISYIIIALYTGHNTIRWIDSREKLAYQWLMISVTSLYVTSLCTSYFRVPAINQILESLDKGDVLLIGAANPPQIQATFFLKNLLGGMCIVLIFIFLPWSMSTIVYRIFICLIASSLWLTSCQYSALSYLIGSRLAEVCSSLEDLQRVRNHLLSSKTVTALSAAHNRLCDISITLNDSYGILITVLVVVCFFVMAACSFLVYNGAYVYHHPFALYFSPRDLHDVPHPTIRILWIILSLVSIWQTTGSSYFVCEKVKIL